MRILFICGSLEPGQDGVGDYTRRLAGECVRNGHKVFVMALHDKFIKKSENYSRSIEGQADFDGTLINTIRISASTLWVERSHYLRNLTEKFEPDWTSVQYVPYAYQKHGLPFRFVMQAFSDTISRIHLMAHELWETENTLQSIAKGFLQKQLIRHFQKKHKIPKIHTTVKDYREKIRDAGLHGSILPLFGNIPVTPLEVLGKLSPGEQLTGGLQALYFGTAPKPQVQLNISDGLNEVLRKGNVNLNLRLAGRLGDFGKKFVECLESKTGCFVKINVTGPLSGNELSKLMHSSHFGISRSPGKFIGKSGSAISMLEHGLPLWLPAHQAEPVPNEDLALFPQAMISNNIREVIDHNLRPSPRSVLPEVYRMLLDDLTTNQN